MPETNKNTKGQTKSKEIKNIPLAERVRPHCLKDIIGQTQAFGPGSMLRSMLEQNKIPNMILWGPPGCGKVILSTILLII